MRMVDRWQLLQSPEVMVSGIALMSGHLLTSTLAGKEMELLV